MSEPEKRNSPPNRVLSYNTPDGSEASYVFGSRRRNQAVGAAILFAGFITGALLSRVFRRADGLLFLPPFIAVIFGGWASTRPRYAGVLWGMVTVLLGVGGVILLLLGTCCITAIGRR